MSAYVARANQALVVWEVLADPLRRSKRSAGPIERWPVRTGLGRPPELGYFGIGAEAAPGHYAQVSES